MQYDLIAIVGARRGVAALRHLLCELPSSSGHVTRRARGSDKLRIIVQRGLKLDLPPLWWPRSPEPKAPPAL